MNNGIYQNYEYAKTEPRLDYNIILHEHFLYYDVMLCLSARNSL